MVFSSHLFLFYFLALLLALYYAFRNNSYRTAMLAVMSYAFYAWANPPWALIMLGSITVDYACGVVLLMLAWLRRDPDGDWPLIPPETPRTSAMRWVLGLSIGWNLAMLGFFKYYNFTEESLNRISELLGGPRWVPVLSVVLPAGISFYTFQSMSYCIDVYRGEARPMTNFVTFCCFETLFPHLVAGPIIRYQQVSEQLRRRSHTVDKFARGVAFFSVGLAKKVLIANPMGYVADASFNAGARGVVDAWYGLVAYAFQIYFDFSGYSDMAVGLAMMLGFVFVQNFNSPYRAESITDFWRRWHISLSTWLRDYLYVPLGGNRRGPARTYLNLIVVMLLGGLWHGASWNFVIWGALHGGMLAFERMQGKDSPYRALPRPVKVVITFLIVCLGWVFFRADTLPQAGEYLASLVGSGSETAGAQLLGGVMYTPYHALVFFIAAVVVWAGTESWQFTRNLSPARATGLMAMLVLAVMFMWTQTENPFLYFRF